MSVSMQGDLSPLSDARPLVFQRPAAIVFGGWLIGCSSALAKPPDFALSFEPRLQGVQTLEAPDEAGRPTDAARDVLANPDHMP